MSKPTQDVIKKVIAFFDALPEETISKCTLCRDTLTHICTSAEVETGAGKATVTRELANKVNKNAAEHDKVTSESLRNRVRYHSGETHPIKWSNSPDKTPPASKPTFNATNDNIKWAKWTWNPVTGCQHGCKYCYARDISNRFYPEKFEPTFRPERLSAPQSTVIPKHREAEEGIRNVFVCSMADLFGEWVPDEWITSVFDACRESPQWNYIFLTKNPEKYIGLYEKDLLPVNAMFGATATNQEQLDRAVDVFDKIGGEIPSFISFEPLLDWVTFADFENNPDDLYDSLQPHPWVDWFIIGAQSRTSQVQAQQPEWDWVHYLLMYADKFNISTFWKPNLTVRPEEYPDILR